MQSLKVLDFSRVKPSERVRAERLASSAAGAALESDVRVEAAQQRQRTNNSADSDGAKTFEPGEGVEGGDGSKSFVVANFSDEQKEQIRQLLANASSAKEVEEIENSVRRGVLPAALAVSGKRKRSDNHDGDDGAAAGAEPTNRVSSDDDETPSAKRRQAS